MPKKGFQLLYYKLAGVLIVVGITLSMLALSIFITTNESKSLWQNYQDISSPKERAIEGIVSNIGYGGMIHQFKNYIIHKDNAQLDHIRTKAGRALAAAEAVG